MVESGQSYGIEAGLGGKNYDLVFDTGSSDLWVFQEGVKCLGPKGHAKPASYCAFGPEFSGNFQDGSIPDKNFYVNRAPKCYLTFNKGKASSEFLLIFAIFKS